MQFCIFRLVLIFLLIIEFLPIFHISKFFTTSSFISSRSKLLRQTLSVVGLSEDGVFPDIQEQLEFFDVGTVILSELLYPLQFISFCSMDSVTHDHL